MRRFKNQLTLFCPKALWLLSSANEGQTEGDIGEMGSRLANEVDRFIRDNCYQVSKISFVCHSLGGIIARSALTKPVMSKYLRKLYTFVSLGSPHCGCILQKYSVQS